MQRTLSLPLTDLQEHPDSGLGNWHFVQGLGVPEGQKTDRPGNHDQFYPPGDDGKVNDILEHSAITGQYKLAQQHSLEDSSYFHKTSHNEFQLHHINHVQVFQKDLFSLLYLRLIKYWKDLLFPKPVLCCQTHQRHSTPILTSSIKTRGFSVLVFFRHWIIFPGIAPT